MNARSERKKMCWNCEGSVSVKAENCPYCDAALYPDAEDPPHKEQEYPSPYKPPRQNNFLQQSSAPPSPFAANEKTSEVKEKDERDEEDVEDKLSRPKEVLITMAMLMSGLVLLLFGLLLFAFSNSGYLVLRWSTAYWPIYASIGALMLCWGFYSLKNID